MKRLALTLLLASAGPTLADPSPPAPPLAVSATIHQHALLMTTPTSTAGGVGGGVGVQLVLRDRYLAQLDVGALWMVGSPISTRLAAGIQRPGAWSPALWLTSTLLWGDHVEIVMAGDTRPAWPAWGVGIRASPLRFHATWGTVSVLEPGLATNLRGTLLELTVLQAGAAW